MEPAGLELHSQASDNCPEPDQSILLSCYLLPIGLFPWGFPDSYDKQQLFGNTKLTAFSR
jgi:hypothetical protein